MTTWDSQRAAHRAKQAYRYVSRTLPPGADYSALDAHTAAAYKAERTGNWPAFLEALAELCSTARREARRAA
jgi:hypothetical protein